MRTRCSSSATCGASRCRGTTTSSRSCRASCSSCRSRSSRTSPPSSTTSPRAAAAITRELGAVDAEAFCLEQGLSRYDARLVAWLVRNHLVLSVTAQKQDISDPEGHQRLRASRSATRRTSTTSTCSPCADVRGTNPKLWNSWKASLFHEFYERVKRALRRGLESPIDQDELIAETQDARARAARRERRSTRAEHQARLGALHRRVLPAAHARGSRLAHAAARRARSRRTTSRWSPCEPQAGAAPPASSRTRRTAQHSFARTTAVLDQLGLTIVDARITPTGDGFSLDLYHVLEDDGAPITDTDAHQRDRARCGARCSARTIARGDGHAPRAAPGAHVHARRRRSRSATTSATAARCSSSSPATGPACCAISARCCMEERIDLLRREDHDRRRARRGRVLRHRRSGQPLDEAEAQQRLAQRLTERARPRRA